jgi:hypothetical protein
MMEVWSEDGFELPRAVDPSLEAAEADTADLVAKVGPDDFGAGYGEALRAVASWLRRGVPCLEPGGWVYGPFEDALTQAAEALERALVAQVAALRPRPEP